MSKFEELIGESNSIFQNINFTSIPDRLASLVDPSDGLYFFCSETIQDIDAFIEAAENLEKKKSEIPILEEKISKLNPIIPKEAKEREDTTEKLEALRDIINISTYALENRMKKFDVDQINDYTQYVQNYKDQAVFNGDKLYSIWNI